MAAWRWMFLAEAVPALVHGLFAFRLPESPRFLVACGDYDKAFQVLYDFTGIVNVNLKIEEIRSTIDSEKRESLADLRGSALGLRPIAWAGILLSVFQQFVSIYQTLLVGSPEMLQGGTGAAVRDGHDRPRSPRVRRSTCANTPPVDVLAGPPDRSWRPPSSQGLAAAPVVQICHKGPDRAGASEENRWYCALLLAADPGPGRLCGRSGHDSAPDRPRSPTRTTSRPPAPVTAPIRTHGPSYPMRKAH